jgi:Plasmid encoded RepA protein
LQVLYQNFMGKVHEIIESHGKAAALLTGADRREVEAAAAYLSDEDAAAIGFLYSGWCQASLPHKRLGDDVEWQIRSDYVNMLVQPGMRTTETGPAQRIGVPYGSRARLIMLYVQSEALRTRSREVNLGRSMNQWLLRMGVPLGGKSNTTIKDQAERISRCSFTFDGKGVKSGSIARMTIFDRAIFTDTGDVVGQGSLFPQVALLSEQFFSQLSAHPVPLDEAAVRAISNNSMALDIYAWLSYRLHVLKGPTPISWVALKGQFGGGFEHMRTFRAHFLENLKLAMAVYREAKVEDSPQGLQLFPSKPPVSPRLTSVKLIPGDASDSGGRTQVAGRVPSHLVSIKPNVNFHHTG